MMIDTNTSDPRLFARLMRLGYVAHAEGHLAEAHRIWQQAALLQPHNEQVWQALYHVVTSDDDRRICLRNILAINPHNTHARRLLDDYFEITQANNATTPDDTGSPAPSSAVWQRVIVRAVEIVVIGVLLSVGIVGVQFII